jgi:hypothetical protein
MRAGGPPHGARGEGVPIPKNAEHSDRMEPMSLAAEKALCAARTQILAERLPAPARDELIASWTEMLEEMAEARSEGAAELVLLDFRSGVEARLAAKLAHTPIERTAP